MASILRVARECATQCLARREGIEHVILLVISILSLLVSCLENAFWSQGHHLKLVRTVLATDLLPRNRVKHLSHVVSQDSLTREADIQ